MITVLRVSGAGRLGGAAVEACHDGVDAGGVPALDGFVVCAEQAGELTPGEEVAAGMRADQAAGADDAAKHQFVGRNERDPGERLVHAGDAACGWNRQAWRGGVGGDVAVHGFCHVLIAGLAQGGGGAGARQAEQGFAGLVQAGDDGLGVDHRNTGNG